ncbi:MAG: SAM hydrolase/SAM-dependent halogenase family protein, partial [Micromonosporaceae bacterium]
FGAAYTSICVGVIYTIAPGANVLVLSDEVPKYATRQGAMLLRQALPYLPRGVHVGIVDPGVGTSRRPIALVTQRGDVLVGPDNGLLLPAAKQLGGLRRAYQLTNPAFRLPKVSATFHGRDIFAPAAGHLVRGVPVADLGPQIDPESLTPLPLPPPHIGDGSLTLSVLYVDEFGSLVLSADHDDLHAAFGSLAYGTPLVASWAGVDGGSTQVQLRYQETFGSVAPGEKLLYGDSSGWLGIAVNQGSAATALGLRDGAALTLTLNGAPHPSDHVHRSTSGTVD